MIILIKYGKFFFFFFAIVNDMIGWKSFQFLHINGKPPHPEKNKKELIQPNNKLTIANWIN